MWPTLISASNDMSLPAVVARLAAHPAVDGILAIGSTGTSGLTPASDYDLILVLNGMPVPLTVALTYVEHRLTDIIFVDAAEIERVIAPEAAPGGPITWGLDRIVPWLGNGSILFDRAGRLAAAQAHAAASPETRSTDGALFAAWFSINYNLRQNLRMAASDNPTYHTALDLRLLYCLSDLWWNYFTLRRLPQRGEKAQIRYMERHDAAFLALFRQCLAEGDRQRRFGLYRRLTELVVAPVGGLWADGVTSVQPDTGARWRDGAPAEALAFWQELIGKERPRQED